MISASSRARSGLGAAARPSSPALTPSSGSAIATPRKIDMLSLMSMSDAFFGRIFHARRELVPFGTVSLTTYFHTDSEELAAEDITPRAGDRRCKDHAQELCRPERRAVVAERPAARDHDADRVFQGVSSLSCKVVIARTQTKQSSTASADGDSGFASPALAMTARASRKQKGRPRGRPFEFKRRKLTPPRASRPARRRGHRRRPGLRTWQSSSGTCRPARARSCRTRPCPSRC